jgi:hypothetical protein
MAKRAPHRMTDVISSRHKIKKDPNSRSILGGKMVGSSQVRKNRRTISVERVDFVKGTTKTRVQKKYTTVRAKKNLPRMKKRNGMTKRAYRKGAKR